MRLNEIELITKKPYYLTIRHNGVIISNKKFRSAEKVSDYLYNVADTLEKQLGYDPEEPNSEQQFNFRSYDVLNGIYKTTSYLAGYAFNENDSYEIRVGPETVDLSNIILGPERAVYNDL